MHQAKGVIAECCSVCGGPVEAAELFRVTRQAVLKRIQACTLLAERHGRDYLIPRSAFVESGGKA